MKKRCIIISIVLIAISLILGIYMFIAELPEYEYFLIIEIISILFFTIAVITLVFYAVFSKITNSLWLRKGYIFIVSSLISVSLLYIPCAFISCYDEYTPEIYYINDTDYIQQYFPLTDIEKVKTRDDLYNSIIMYTNYPGFSKIDVCNKNGFKDYEMQFTKSLNPVYNLRSTIDIITTVKFNSDSDLEQSNTYKINGVKIHVYTYSKSMYGYINKYGNTITVAAKNCNTIFTSAYAFAEYIYKQYELVDECLSLKYFRDEPWYNVAYYIKALSEPYENNSYFPD